MEWTPRRVISVIGYAVVGISIIVLFVSDAQQNSFDERREADIAAAVTKANQETIHCIQTVIDENSDSTRALRDASKSRADADYEVKRQAIAEGRPLNDPHVIAAWLLYEKAHVAYNKALANNPLPNVEARCG